VDEVEEAAPVDEAAVDPIPEPRARRCVVCLSTIPPPRRTVCSEFCARKRKLMLQDFRRRKARG